MNIKKQDALKLLKVLEDAGYEARLVGGCVRDELLGLLPKDFDIACSASPDEMQTVFKVNKLRYLDYGKEHGTLTALMRSGPIEVTTLREDVKTDGRRAEVAFHTDFKADALRRDFTINAMSENRQGKIFDYFEGRKHLREKRIVFVGDPKLRIQEDYLRILRYFRFKGRFQLKSNAQTLKAIAEEVHGLKHVSQERITKEILEIFQAKSFTDLFREMLKTSVLNFVFPDFQNLSASERRNLSHTLHAFKTYPLEKRSLARMSALFWFIGLHKKKTDLKFTWSNYIRSEAQRLRLSHDDRKHLLHFIEAAEALSDLQSQRADWLLYVDRFDGNHEGLFLNFVHPFLKVIFAKSISRLKKLTQLKNVEKKYGKRRQINLFQGDEVMKILGIASGPLLGETLKLLRYAYLEGEWDTKEEGIKWLKRLAV